MDRNLREIVLHRLEKETRPDDDWAVLVLAALEGPESLVACLDGGDGEEAPAGDGAGEGAAPPAAGVAFLRSIRVEGFRGIGPPAVLEFTPGPGLTLVVGRNGCGKSSFAEGLELLLTGETYRWTKRASVWREGWRNLHHPDASITAEFALEGERGACNVTRSWDDGARWDDAHTWAQVHGKPRAQVASLGWESALEAYRPILSYNELGTMLDQGPSKLYDALAAILGLEVASEAQGFLQEERTRREKAKKEAEAERTMIAETLAALDDERTRRVIAALERDDWGLDEIERILTGAGADDERAGEMETLRRIAGLASPDPEAVNKAVASHAEAAKRLASASATLAGRADDLATLLDRTLEFHEQHGDADCPVCGKPGALDATWRKETTTEVARLRKTAKEVSALRAAAAGAESALRAFVPPVSRLLERASGLGLDEAVAAAREAAAAWSEATAAEDAAALAKGLKAAAKPLHDATRRLREAAAAELARREDAWRPVASTLARWLPDAREARDRGESVATLKRAETWLKDAADDIRDERFAPIATRAIRIWERMRVQSNVALGAVRLGGAGKRRHVDLRVDVDGEEGAALGVMSQGELNSLALSLFIPRATLPESPFRFVLVDDPVQSMDPARVDGLARVLAEAAEDRQVIVFTHDDRLPEAVRRLDIEAKVLEVTRREGSIVEVRRTKDPAARYIEDAMALAYTDGLPAEASRRVIPGLCREAVEAACMETVRRRRIGRGEPHAEVEKQLLEAKTLASLAALAIFDDASRAGDVMGWINRERGRTAGDAFRACNVGAHGEFGGVLVDLVREIEKLAHAIQGLR